MKLKSSKTVLYRRLSIVQVEMMPYNYDVSFNHHDISKSNLTRMVYYGSHLNIITLSKNQLS